MCEHARPRSNQMQRRSGRAPAWCRCLAQQPICFPRQAQPLRPDEVSRRCRSRNTTPSVLDRRMMGAFVDVRVPEEVEQKFPRGGRRETGTRSAQC